jgi:cellobiose phosphorylase
MRGTRDASQDFCGMNPIDPNWAKQTMLQLFRHQRSTDGWFPRQISTISRQAPHDMRNFSDGGAFLLELFYEYMTFTRDTSFLEEKCYWLDTDEESTVLDHIIRCVDYYIRPQGDGEHGLCKAWYGDWWDILDDVGSEGRGESVTVTAQMILNLKNMVEVFKWLQKNHKLDVRYLSLIDDYAKARENFIKAMKTYAYNSAGYFNGYFNDDGKWLFSNNDPDGEERLYLVSNVWSIICGVADDEMTKKVLQNIEEKTFANMGYNLHSLAFKKPVPKAGRVGSGTMPYVAPYNHAQSFLVRACCVAGDVDMAYKATRYILPIEQKYAPVEKTFAPPFTIANAYSNSEANLHRVELP